MQFLKPTRRKVSFTIPLFFGLFLFLFAFVPIIDAVIWADTGFGCFTCGSHTQATGMQLLLSKWERLRPAAPYLAFYNLTVPGYVLLLLVFLFSYLLACMIIKCGNKLKKQKKK